MSISSAQVKFEGTAVQVAGRQAVLRHSDLHCAVRPLPSDIQLGSLIAAVLFCSACRLLGALGRACPHDKLGLGVHLVHCALAKSACSTAGLRGGLWSA